MKLDEIRTLIKIVANSGVSEIELQIKDFSIKIIKSDSSHEPILVQIPTYENTTNLIPALHKPDVAASSTQISKNETNDLQVDESKYLIIKSPMIGTYYRTSGLGKPPFVNIGDQITNGQTLCIIEAMKLFNEIESEVSGKIIKILIDNSSPVEYDTPLFLVDPS